MVQDLLVKIYEFSVIPNNFLPCSWKRYPVIINNLQKSFTTLL